MKLYSFNKEYKLYKGSMLDMLDVIEPNSVDSIITDPPYELNFMNRGWDNSGIAFQKETWEKCYDVLKPGGYLLAFGGSRTFHRIACAIEDAGFEIRDTIMWLYGSGFPKSLNLGKSIESKLSSGGASPKYQRLTSMGDNYTPTGQKDYHKGMAFKDATDEYIKNDNNIELTHEESKKWKGWGTCLKPSYEPIIVARKPCENSITDNVLKYGVGGINIDECRVCKEEISTNNAPKVTFAGGDLGRGSDTSEYNSPSGRFPANVILTYDESDYDEVCGDMPDSKGASSQNNYSNGHIYRGQSLQESNTSLNGYREWYNDDGSASRYFYCAKASKFDRNEGLDGSQLKNIHPTVKPSNLMRYLVRLVSPKGATILDCFNGSGSTGKAVILENKQYNKEYKYIGIELTEEYLPIAKSRIEYICNNEFDFTEEKEHKVKKTHKKKINSVSLWE